jgi:predicted RNase H-like HicB family nuclease
MNNTFGKNRYLVIIEPTETGFSAYSRDLPDCVSKGGNSVEIEANPKTAIEHHLEGLHDEGEPVPEPSCAVSYYDV